MGPQVSIIIVNYNGLEYLEKCLNSIFIYLEYPYADRSFKYEVIIVDNGSTDGSIGFIENTIKAGKESDRVKLVKSEKNLGFASASNLGAKYAEGQYLLFLNPDTEFFRGHFEEILEFVQLKEKSGKVGALGVKIKNTDNSLQYSCRSFPTLARQFYQSYFLSRIFKKSRLFGSYYMTYWDHKKTRKVDWLSGAFLIVKITVFREIGGFSQDYFMYSEDADFCLRLSRKGYNNYYFPRYHVMHHDAGIASRNMALREAQLWKSRKTYFSKNYSPLHGKILSLLYLSYVLNRLVISVMLALLNMQTRKKSYLGRTGVYINTLRIYFAGK